MSKQNHLLFNGGPMLDVANDIVQLCEAGKFTEKSDADALFGFFRGLADAMGMELSIGIEKIGED